MSPRLLPALGLAALTFASGLPAWAGALEDLAADLGAASGEARLRAAYATCLLHGGGAQGATPAFAAAGWQVWEDADGGFAEFGVEGEDHYGMAWLDGGFCMVATGENGTGSARAEELLREVLARTGAPFELRKTAEQCRTLVIGEIEAEITGDGNDPACQADDSSAIRFYWPARAGGE
ncbi:hypothetical protein [Pseudogemmobacter sonorensis]|uniref:hypothetical protein n=1 Tax=Pseudogemmobacter sonorensis TaxID=2989681 RepID=UPI0036A8AB8F